MATTNKTNWWKWGIIGALIIGAMWAGCEYGVRSVIKNTKSDTSINKYSIIHSLVPIPVVIDGEVEYMVRTEHDTLEIEGDIRYLPSGTPQYAVDELNDYHKRRKYDTTIANKGDTVSIKSEVYQNKLVKQDVSISLEDSVFTKVVTVIQPKKFVMLFDVLAIANYKNFGLGAGFTAKMPNDNTYSVNGKFITGGPGWMFEGKVGLPIRLTRKIK